MAVKAYNIVLILVRLVAIGVVTYWAYVLFQTILPSPRGFAVPGFETLVSSMQGPAVASGLAGLALYFLAPFLAWAATRDLKKRNDPAFEEYS